MATVWTQEKIDKQTKYFANERIEKKGNFTEYVVRTYYCIYRACSLNDGISCYTREVSAYKIKYIIYEGFYGGIPDHDFINVIDDCVKHLKLMHYINLKKIDNNWMFYLNRPLDFLLDGEHDDYLRKYNITRGIHFLTDT